MSVFWSGGQAKVQPPDPSGRSCGRAKVQPPDPRSGHIPSLREFVLNSRHPDPRRVWKGVSNSTLKFISGGLPASGVIRGHPGSEFRAAFICRQAQYFRHICSELDLQFRHKTRFSRNGGISEKKNRRRQRWAVAEGFLRKKNAGGNAGQSHNGYIRRKVLILELIGVVVARPGLILGQNGATPSRKLSRCLPPPFHIIFVLKHRKRHESDFSWKIILILYIII